MPATIWRSRSCAPLGPTASCLSNLRELAGAVADGLRRHSRTIEEREQHIRQGRVIGVTQMLPALELAAASAEQGGRQRELIVAVAVAHVAAVQNDRVIQQRSIAI